MIFFQHGQRARRERSNPVVQIPGPGREGGGADPGHDAVAPRGFVDRPPRPGRADLLGAEQPSAVVRAHAEMVERAAANMNRIRSETWRISSY